MRGPSTLLLIVVVGSLKVFTADAERTIHDILVQSGRFQGVIRALNSTTPNLLEQMKETRRQFTLFAPNDQVYDTTISPDLQAKLLSPAWTEHRQTWVRLHLLSFAWPRSQWTSRRAVPSLSGLMLNMTATTVNDITPSAPDITAVNGVIHEIPAVFEHRFLSRSIWQASQGAQDFSTVASLTEQLGLVEGLADGPGPNTIFVPTNAAFGRLAKFVNLRDTLLMKEIFLYHVISGQNLYAQNVRQGDTWITRQGESINITFAGVNNAVIETPNMVMANGVVHTIQQVLIPPSIQARIDDGSLTNSTPPLGTSGASATAATAVAMIVGAGGVMLGM